MDADKMIVTKFHHLTTDEVIRLALSEAKSDLEKELVARLIKATKNGGSPNYGE